MTFTNTPGTNTLYATDIKQINHYYPFGLNMGGPGFGAQGANKYQYNGIELNTEFGLNMNMAFFRGYDPAVGRWWQIDPKPNVTESTYIGMRNNPIRYNDPLGDTIIVDQKGYITRNDNIKNDNVYTTNKGKFIPLGHLGGKIYIDFIYNNLIRDNVIEAKGIWRPGTFKTLVTDHGRWDLKLDKNSIFGLGNDGKTTFSFKGITMESQDVGNHHFGIVAKATGLFPEETILREAGRNQMTKNGGRSTKPEWQPFTMQTVPMEHGGTMQIKTLNPPYGDDPRDQAWIQAGFDYYKQNYDK